MSVWADVLNEEMMAIICLTTDHQRPFVISLSFIDIERGIRHYVSCIARVVYLIFHAEKVFLEGLYYAPEILCHIYIPRVTADVKGHAKILRNTKTEKCATA